MSYVSKFCSFKYEQFVIGNKSFTNEELLVYGGIGLNFLGNTNVLLTYNHIKNIIFGKQESKAKMRIVKDGFNGLVKRGYIKILDQYTNSEFVCDVSNISHINKDRFFMVTYEEFYKIVSDCGNVNSGALLRYYLCCLSTFEKNKITMYDYKFGYKSQMFLSNLCGSNLPTIKKYNDLLMNAKVIYVVRRKQSVYKEINNGNIYKSDTNAYCRYEDKDKCIEYIKSGCIQIKKDEYISVSNEMRSLSQKYNYFARTYKNKRCENMDKVEDAYEAAVQWNEYAKQDYEKAIEDGKNPKEPKYKDLSIFDQYDLTV